MFTLGSRHYWLNSMSLRPGLSKTLVSLFFFGSGFAALLYQIVWLKYLNLLFGNTTYATAAVLCAFMFGLSVGSRLAPKLKFLFRTPLRSYGIVEIGIGLFALSFPQIYEASKVPFAAAFAAIGPESYSYNLFVFLLAALVLVIPTSFMGASLPLLSQYLMDDSNIAGKAGLLYGINTGGAVAGILCSAFLLIPLLGLYATILVGVIINLLVGLLCFLGGNGSGSTPAPLPVAETRADGLLGLYAISGLLALGYEVLWTRILVLHLGSSVYAYAIMLAIFLLGISLGSFTVGRWIADKGWNHRSLFCWIQIFWALSILIQILQLAFLSNTLYGLARMFSRLTITTQFLVLFVGVFQLLFLPTFLSGALFPVVVDHLFRKGETVRSAISLAYSYNTIGGIFGSLIASFLLIPVCGTQLSLILFAMGNLLLALRAVPPLSHGEPQKYFFLGLLILFLLVAFLEQRYLRIIQSAGIFQMESEEQLLHLEEDVSATISVEKRNEFGHAYRSLSVNGVNVAGTSPDLVSIQKLQGHVPIGLFGAKKQKQVLHIGFGSGGTAYSVSLYPNTSITVVELTRGIVSSANAYFQSVNHGVVDSGTLRLIYFDGRSFLQNTRETFDVILSDSIHPRYSGNGSLYTKEYYGLVENRLNNGGVHSQWIPLYSLASKNLKEILRAFGDVFPETYVWYVNSTVNPYIIVTGRKRANGIALLSIADAWSLSQIREDLRSIGITSPYFLLDYFFFGSKGLSRFTEGIDPHLDDRLTVEYESSRILNRQLSWLENFKQLTSYREPIGNYLVGASREDHAILSRFYDATTDNLRGQENLLEGKVREAEKYFVQAKKKNAADPDPLIFRGSE